jgi:hypothetical protein
VLSSTTRNSWGGNVGGGIALPIAATGAEVFVDVRYYYAPTSPSLTAMVPIMFGIRYTAPKQLSRNDASPAQGTPKSPVNHSGRCDN